MSLKQYCATLRQSPIKIFLQDHVFLLHLPCSYTCPTSARKQEQLYSSSLALTSMCDHDGSASPTSIGHWPGPGGTLSNCEILWHRNLDSLQLCIHKRSTGQPDHVCWLDSCVGLLGATRVHAPWVDQACCHYLLMLPCDIWSGDHITPCDTVHMNRRVQGLWIVISQHRMNFENLSGCVCRKVLWCLGVRQCSNSTSKSVSSPLVTAIGYLFAMEHAADIMS